MKTCQKCGARAENDDIYCPDCGTKLKAVGITKKITIWTIFKIIGLIIIFIIFINIFKTNPIIALFILVLFLVWTGIINAILKKLFNAELSIGVKIIITVIMITLLFFGTTKLEASRIAKPDMIVKYEEPVETGEAQQFIEKINKAIGSRDYSVLKEMLERGTISTEVFTDLQLLLDNRDNMKVSLNLIAQNFQGDQAELIVETIIRTNYEEKGVKTTWFFRKTNGGWHLFVIKPRLSDIKLSTSFEKSVEDKLQYINRPIVSTGEARAEEAPIFDSSGYRY